MTLKLIKSDLMKLLNLQRITQSINYQKFTLNSLFILKTKTDSKKLKKTTGEIEIAKEDQTEV